MDQYAFTQAKIDVLKALKAAIGKTYVPSIEELETPPDPELGDIAFPCFQLAKGMKRNPAEIATELAAKIGPKGLIGNIHAEGPYVNFDLDPVKFAELVIGQVLLAKDEYGRHMLAKKKRIMVEYANMNTHKELHIGHLRNITIGFITIKLLRMIGHEVIATSYINDLGNNVAKCLWSYKKFHDGEAPEAGEEINFLGTIYSDATKALENNEEGLKEVTEIQRSLEEKKGEWHAIWKRTWKWSVDALYRIFKELDIPIDVQYYESDLIGDVAGIVENLMEEGIAIKDNGAILVDLEEEKLGKNLLVKSDGAHLYAAKDLALAQQKQNDYRPDRSIIVVDTRQSLEMRQLFATLKKMGLDIPYEQLGYNFVTLPDGAMSSRKGNIVRYETLRDQMRERARQSTMERHEDWSDKQITKTANAIAHAAMMYTMAKQDPNRDIVFDMEQALSFEGMSGPYLLYTASRISSLLSKTKIKPKFTGKAAEGKEAQRVVQLLAEFPHVVAHSAENLDLADVPQYAFSLAQAFSTFYGAERVIDEEDRDGTAGRLALCQAVLVTLTNAMAVMNITPLKEM